MYSLMRIATNDRDEKGRKGALRLGLIGGLLLLTLLLAACSSASPTDTSIPVPTDTPAPEVAVTPAVAVEDQELMGNQVTIAQVVSNGAGWIVIHADQDGKPGPVLGYSPVADGENNGVAVSLDLTGLTGTLHAMLHTDAGQMGTYEFPGDDVPVKQGEAILMSPFKLEVAEGNVNVSIVNFSFSPAQLIVRVGTAVTWTNNDGNVRHTTTSDDGVWDSGLLSGGGTFSVTFDQPGIYPYYCQPHGGPGGQGMSGTIIVIP